MIAIIIGDGQILFDGIYYPENDFLVNIYREQLKPSESLVNDDLHTKIAVRLKKGEKLKVCSYHNIKKLGIYNIHHYWKKSKNGKYIEFIPVVNKPFTRFILYDCYTDISIIRYGYQFFPKIDAWYNESKLLNETNLIMVIKDYINELNQELERFESMLSYYENIDNISLTNNGIVYSIGNKIEFI